MPAKFKKKVQGVEDEETTTTIATPKQLGMINLCAVGFKETPPSPSNLPVSQNNEQIVNFKVTEVRTKKRK